MGFDKWKVTAIIVVVIACIGFIFPFMKDSPLLQIETKPNVQLGPVGGVNNNNSKYLLRVTNDGGQSITGLILTVQSAYKIMNMTDKLSTVPVILKQSNASVENGHTYLIDNNFLQITIPSLAHGNGSLVSLELNIGGISNISIANSNNIDDSLRIFVVYKDGSMIIYPTSTETSTETSFWFSLIKPPVILYYLGLYIPILIFLLLYYNERKHRDYVKGLIQSVRDVRKILRNDLTSKVSLLDQLAKMKFKCDKRFVNDSKDNSLIQRLYAKLIERDSVLTTSSDIQILGINKTAIDFCNQVLREVNWSRYE